MNEETNADIKERHVVFRARHLSGMSQIVVIAAVAVSSCGSGTTVSSQPPVSSAATSVAVVGAVTAGPTTSGPPVTEPQKATTDSAPPDDTTAVEAPVPVRNGARITLGHRFTTDKLLGDAADFTFLAPASGAWAALGDGYLALTADQTGKSPLIQAAEMDLTRILTNPSQNLDGLIGPDDSQPAPADVLGWFASRPGVTAGAIADGPLGGLPARSMTYSVGPFDGQTSCTAQDARPCLATLYNPIGAALYYSVGDSGTMYELVVEGRHLLVDVADQPEAATLAASIQFSPRRPADVQADTQRLPLTGPLTPATTYFWTGSSLATYILAEGAGLEVTSNFRFGANPPLQLGVGDARCMSISDGSTSSWVGGATLDPNSTLAAMPDDLLAALTTLRLLTVTSGPAAGTLDGHATTTLELTARGKAVDLLAGSLTARAATTTRVMLVSRGDGQQPDVIMVDVGSPCEAMLTNIHLIAAGTP